MAKILGPLHSDFAAGSLGSTVYKRNQYGFYCYEKPAFVDNPTDTQTAWRENFAEVCAVWDNPNSITADRRAMWVDFAQRFSSSTRYGRSIYCSPRQWFLKLNCHRNKMDLDLVLYPPKDPSPSYFPIVSFSQTSDGLFISAVPWPDEHQLIHVSWVPYQSTLRYFCPRSEEIISYISHASADPFLLIPNEFLSSDLKRYFFIFRSIDGYGRLTPRQIIFFDCIRSWIPDNPYLCESSTWIYDYTPSTNYGASVELNARFSGGVGNNRRSLIFFNFDKIPIGTVFSSALLHLWQISHEYNETTLNIYNLKRMWFESEATWEIYATGASWQSVGAAGANDYDSSITASFVSSEGARWVEIDVTDLINEIVANNSNYGQIIRQNSGYNLNSIFASSRHATTSLRPFLELTL